jgi:hypothetical protein
MASEMKIELRQISASTSEATLGRHQVLIDRRVEKGGSDAGPMGGELFLAAVGGCFMSNLLAAIKGREAGHPNGLQRRYRGRCSCRHGLLGRRSIYTLLICGTHCLLRRGVREL